MTSKRFDSQRAFRVGFKGDYPMWTVEAASAEDAIRQIVKSSNSDGLNNLREEDLEAK